MRDFHLPKYDFEVDWDVQIAEFRFVCVGVEFVYDCFTFGKD